MEEQKKNEQASEQPKKLSYEQLQNVAGQLQQQNMQLRKMLQEANYTNMFKRLDYLFKVMEFPHMFSDKFVQKCSTEIEASVSVPEEVSQEEETAEKE